MPDTRQSSYCSGKKLDVFREFCKLRSLNIEHFEERDPPKPDIYPIASTQGVAYELTECIEQRHARSLTEVKSIREEIREYYESLAPEKKKQLDDLHHGKVIGVCFSDGVSQNTRKKSLPDIIDFLLSIPATFGSDQLERKEEPMGQLLDYISMKQIKWDGINWQPDLPYRRIEPEEQLRQRIIDNMENKKYESDYPIELIV